MPIANKGQEFIVALITDVIPRFDEEMFPADAELKAGENVVADMPPFLRKMFSYRKYMKRELARLAVELQFTSTADPSFRQLAVQVDEIGTKSEFLEKMFWCLLEEHVGWDPELAIGVRRGWKVVRYPRTDDTGDLLRKLLSGLK